MLREGAGADITIFDLDSVSAALDGNKCYPKGIEHVVLNGQVVVDAGRYHGAMAGGSSEGVAPVRIRRRGPCDSDKSVSGTVGWVRGAIAEIADSVVVGYDARTQERTMAIPAQHPEPADAAARRAVEPVTVYTVDRLPAYDRLFYETVRSDMTLVDELTVPPRDGRAFDVPAGHLFRIVNAEGSQVGDLNLWNAADLAERFYSGKTRALHATHVSTGDRLWSCFPWLRPMATITHDTLDWYGFDEFGAGRP